MYTTTILLLDLRQPTKTGLSLSQIGHSGLLWTLASKCTLHYWAEVQADQGLSELEGVWRRGPLKRRSGARDVVVLGTLPRPASSQN